MSFELSSVSPPQVLPAQEVLRRNIADKIVEFDGLSAERLARVYEFILQMEMERLYEEICNASSEDDLSPEASEAAKLEHRKKHPYPR